MTSTMLPPPAGELTIMANGRKYTAASAASAMDFEDDDGIIASANGWMRIPTGSPDQPSWPEWGATAVVTPPARGPIGSPVDITVNGRPYVCNVGATITVPTQDAIVMTANGWAYVYPWTAGKVTTLKASALSEISALSIMFDAVPSYITNGMFLTNLNDPLSIPAGVTVTSTSDTTVGFNVPIAITALLFPNADNPTSTTLSFATADVSGKMRVGQYIADNDSNIPADTHITNLQVEGDTTIATISNEVTDTVGADDEIEIGGVVPGDVISFSNGQVRTSAASAIGSSKITFAELPPYVNGATIEGPLYVTDVTATAAIPGGTTVVDFDPVAMTVTLSTPVVSPGVGLNDVIGFGFTD
jgi:hypothetical protein